MGICASGEYGRKGGIAPFWPFWPSTAKLIDLDGKLQEFRHPTIAGRILSHNPNCVLCCSDSMYINSSVPLIPKNEELQLGQIYFLLPLSKSHVPLSLQDLCALAIKASSALAYSEPASMRCTFPFNN
ncbi:hypothetical protein I3842_06G139400 [Carya illinoinensis]|uniref:Uncharacterized protein n=1 Tax=Carya illinoinensis TaxID=32201 RepID=A0A922EWR7_CARIL|nr:hypothetical protein I3842_06G139400 [Carya illinoinensis]